MNMTDNEEQTQKDKGKEESEGDSNEGDKPSATEVLKQQSERIKELEQEKLDREVEDAKKQLGGGSEAGSEIKPKEETPKEYGDRILAGR